MKIVFATRNSVGGRYFANLLNKSQIDFELILETGKTAKKKKLRRLFKKNHILLWPKVITDIVAIIIYSKLCNKWLIKHLLKPKKYEIYPQELKKHSVDCINDKKASKLLSALKPDILLVYGTSILKPDIINKAKHYTLNIHGGKVPNYRNVHGDFWLLANKDYSNAETTMHIDNGIDTGDIAINKKINIDKNDNIFSYKKKILVSSGEALLEIIKQAKHNKISKKKQSEKQAKVYDTPTFFEIATNFKKIF